LPLLKSATQSADESFGKMQIAGMKTVADRIRDNADKIQVDLEALLKQHSSLHLWKPKTSRVRVLGGNYYWDPLEEPGRQLQAKLIESYKRFSQTIRVLLREQPSDTGTTLSACEHSVMAVIEQNSARYEGDIAKILAGAVDAIHQQAGLVGRLYQGVSGDHTLFVPDTNALYYNPSLEKWRFTDSPKFIVVLTPTILSELDDHKVNHRVESVRTKAETLIRIIKGYRARGVLTEGVPLVTGVSQIKALAVEPKKEASLPWLDFDNNDDRFIASSIEVMRTAPRSPVLIVSRDLNVQNKAEFANLPFAEPPDP
jgi:hypothetical protein